MVIVTKNIFYEHPFFCRREVAYWPQLGPVDSISIFGKRRNSPGCPLHPLSNRVSTENSCLQGRHINTSSTCDDAPQTLSARRYSTPLHSLTLSCDGSDAKETIDLEKCERVWPENGPTVVKAQKCAIAGTNLGKERSTHKTV
jgi:hypothetical protein